MYVYRKGEPPVVRIVREESGLKRGRPLSPFDPALCGQNKGYQQHFRHGLEPCQPCKTAHTEYEKDRQASKRK